MRKYLPLSILGAFLLLLLLSNCKHDLNEMILNPKDTTKVIVPPPVTNNNVKDSACFSDDVKPLLVSFCAQSGCHDDTTHQSGIILNSYQNAISTISGNFLLQAINDTGALRMPPANSSQLTAAQIATIQGWVSQGMKDGVDCLGSCDTTNVTFTGTINPIIQTYCVGCHTTSGTNLVGYASVKVTVDNGKLYNTTFHVNTTLPMPQGSSQLPYCKLRQIKKWIDAGAPNN